ncbi:MAG: DUF302 domain-containing protein [Gammaproteobacteria bacterium]|nr:DUF302 domain-containing protein [Gammaproteobacteria bacterium]
MIKKLVLAGIFSVCCLPAVNAADNGMISVKSNFPVGHTADRFIGIIKKKGMRVMAHVKHSEAAKKVGIDLQPEELVIFGNPKLGAPMMKCAPTLGIDLPQKMLIWQDENQQTWLTYNNPVYIADRHNLPQDCRENLHKIANALAKFSALAAE